MGMKGRMQTQAVVLVTAVCVVATLASTGTPSVTTYNHGRRAVSGELIFEDNFDTLDMETWQHELTLWGGGNGEFEVYNNNRTNSYIRDGVLYLRPTFTADRYGNDFLYSGTLDMNGGSPYDQCTCPLNRGCVRSGTADYILNPILSAAVRTVTSFTFTYGRVEVKAKVPAGDWIWPAIWMMPSREAYGNWPTSGEIGIMESRGNRDYVRDRDGVQVGTQRVQATLHWGADPISNRFFLTHFVKDNASGYDTDFHVYQMEWTPDHIKFSVDDEEIGKVAPPDGGFWEMGGFDQDTWRNNPWQQGSKMAPFDQPFYLKFNVAVGGMNFFPDEGVTNGAGAKPWSDHSETAFKEFWEGRDQWLFTWQGDSTAMLIDYVRVYAL